VAPLGESPAVTECFFKFVEALRKGTLSKRVKIAKNGRLKFLINVDLPSPLGN
jgi:hypothetical protein